MVPGQVRTRYDQIGTRKTPRPFQDKLMIYCGVIFGGVAAVTAYRIYTNNQQMMMFLKVAEKAIEQGRWDALATVSEASVEAEKIIKE